MKKTGVIIVLFFMFFEVFPQMEWQFKYEITRNNYYLLEGKIADKYPITMYLTKNGNYCTFESKWDYSYGVKGWYYYDNVKKKIPLLGSIEHKENDCSVNLFVPANLLDTLNNEDCKIEDYKEIFVANECYLFNSMKWKMINKDNWSDVNLNLIKSNNGETEVKISMEINKLEFFNFDLTNATDNKYIDSVNLLSSKAKNNDFYLIFSFEQMSNPGSMGLGHCGAGIEEYIAFLHINESFDVVEFTYYLNESCYKSIEQEYTYDKNHPEYGLEETE